ncbi:MAG: hypothetical protein FWC75_01875 [Oscillospiraceae bacterium]|nr:hypothetical protein [Oscillospiraceae bacterium]
MENLVSRGDPEISSVIPYSEKDGETLWKKTQKDLPNMHRKVVEQPKWER